MSNNSKIVVLNLPSPPHYNVLRDLAGGFGIAWYNAKRADYGQSADLYLQPCLAYLSSVLSRQNCDFKILDCQALKLNKPQVLKYVVNESPDIIISLIGLPSLTKDVELLRDIKKTVPKAIIVGVGTTCRVMPREVLLNGGVDIVLRSDYPYISNLLCLVRTIQQGGDLKQVSGVSFVKDGKVYDTPNSLELDLSVAPPPSYDQLKPERYGWVFSDLSGEKYKFVPILGSKGCHYKCYYCPYPLGFGEKATYRNPKDIVDEMEYLYSNHGIRGFLFRNQSFTMNRKHAIAVCDEIRLRALDVAWFCEARVDEVSRQVLRAMKEAGCKRIHYGVETGDPNLIGAGKPGVTLNTVRKAFLLTKETGMWRTAHVILGWPDETNETLERTRKFVVSLDPDDVNWNTIVPYPGTKLHEIALREGLILTHDWSKYTPDAGIMNTRNLTAAQLSAVKQRIARYYFRYKVIKLLPQFASGKRKTNMSMGEIKGLIRTYLLKS